MLCYANSIDFASRGQPLQAIGVKIFRAQQTTADLAESWLQCKHEINDMILHFVPIGVCQCSCRKLVFLIKDRQQLCQIVRAFCPEHNFGKVLCERAEVTLT